MVSQFTSLAIVSSTVCSGADQRTHQSSASLAFVREIHRSPVNSPHKRPVTRKMFAFDDVIMYGRKIPSLPKTYHKINTHIKIYTFIYDFLSMLRCMKNGLLVGIKIHESLFFQHNKTNEKR